MDNPPKKYTPSLFAPNIWNRVRMEEETDNDDDQIKEVIDKIAHEDKINAMTIPVGQGKSKTKPEAIDDIPPERLKPIPYALEPSRLEDLLVNRVAEMKFRRTDIQPLIIACYLTAGRIKEVLQIRKSDVMIKQEQGHEIMEFNLVTEKRKKKKNKDGIYVKPIPPRRAVPVSMENGLCNETSMVNILVKHYDKFDSEDFLFCLSEEEKVLLDRTNIQDRLLDTERKLAYYYTRKIDFGPLRVKKYYPIEGYREQMMDTYLGYPHYLRHNRLTHLSQYYRMSDQELMEIAGWTDTLMASTYVHISAAGIARHMIDMIEQTERK